MPLLTTRQVQDLFKVDRSTVYRMAEDGRLPAVKVGRQWRFPADRVRHLIGDAEPHQTLAALASAPRPAPIEPVDLRTLLPADSAQAVADLVGDLFGVMAVVTDMAGRPLTTVANPCGFFSTVYDGVDAPDRCTEGWRELGEQIDLEPQFMTSHLGFLCARSFIRSGTNLVGMVIVGGIARDDWPPADHEIDAIARHTGLAPDTIRAHVDEVYRVDRAHRDWIVRNLSQVSDLISRLADEHGRLVHKLQTIAAVVGA